MLEIWEKLIIPIIVSFAIIILLDKFFFKDDKAFILLRKNLYLGFFIGTIYAVLYFFNLKILGDLVAIIYAAKLLDNIIVIYIRRIVGEFFKTKETEFAIILIARTFLWLTAVHMVLSSFGIDIAPLLTSLGIGSIVIGLALQSTLSNFFSGMAIASEGILKEGDIIELPELGIRGTIIDITWRGVHIKTISDTIAIIPFNYINNNIIINKTKHWPWYWGRINFGISYYSDLDKAKQLIRTILKEKGLEGDVRFTNFGDNNIEGVIFFKVYNILDELKYKDELIREIKRRFDREGIEISFPNRNIYLRPEGLDKVLDIIKRGLQ
ncbi:NEQ531 [Nanoarchaeum equitans Kin4-M]|uniref:NEQ531 n=1 Tax=Nanoarchaeum equitans (strain Kin4-M) TaxID=228908 RepID=Q74M35_NANEQ|nr:NEQ531 [Nanoarchaeum equitans Kin4-M]